LQINLAFPMHKKQISSWLDSTFETNVSRKFVLEDFSTNDSLLSETSPVNETFTNNYASVLRWSPDSLNILDLGSYGSVLVKNKAGSYTVEAGEPDTEVALLDLTKNVRRRLLMVGPSSTITNGKWLNNDELVVTGTFNKTGNGENDTLMWMINIKDNSFRLYNVTGK